MVSEPCCCQIGFFTSVTRSLLDYQTRDLQLDLKARGRTEKTLTFDNRRLCLLFDKHILEMISGICTDKSSVQIALVIIRQNQKIKSRKIWMSSSRTTVENLTSKLTMFSTSSWKSLSAVEFQDLMTGTPSKLFKIIG